MIWIIYVISFIHPDNNKTKQTNKQNKQTKKYNPHPVIFIVAQYEKLILYLLVYIYFTTCAW